MVSGIARLPLARLHSDILCIGDILELFGSACNGAFVFVSVFGEKDSIAAESIGRR